MIFDMNILLTSVGRRSYMVKYFKNAISNNGILHAANSVKTYAMTIADKSVVTPLIYSENYIEFILNYCLENHIVAALSLFDIDLPILAQNKQKFTENGIKLLVSNYDFVNICNDKWLTYKFLEDNGFNTPKTFLTVNSALTAISEELISFPLIIKPRWGMGSIGIFEAYTQDELIILYNKTINSIQNSYLKYESKRTPNNFIIIQEKMFGEEYGLDIFNDLNGNFLTSIPKKKIEMRAGETDSAVIIKSSDLSQTGKRLSEVSKHIGNMDVDCFFENGKFYIIEMNCRFGGQYPFCHLAGADFPKAIIEMLQGKKVLRKHLYARAGVVGVKDINPVIL